MKSFKKFLSALLSVIIAFSFSVYSSAEETDNVEGKAYSPFATVIDSILGAGHDVIFGLLTKMLAQKDIPTYEEYTSKKHEYIYDGTNGKSNGDGWSAGFAMGSIIPEIWRCDASGEPDPEGMCVNKKYATGGYQNQASKIYTDQNLSMVILSNGDDANKNGVDDIIIFASIDGVGVAAGTTKLIRAQIEDGLSAFGIEHEDILSINISATHCHVAFDTQGMTISTMFNNRLNPFTDYDRSINQEMEESIVARATECAVSAYERMEQGTLSFFETDPVDGANDKLNSGAKTKNYFSCFLFNGVSGEKTIISNIGAHPTSWLVDKAIEGKGINQKTYMMFADYPYFMAMALKDAGYNLVFAQSAQAAVGGPSIDEGGNVEAAEKWSEKYALSKEDWVQLYGEKYADKWYTTLELGYENEDGVWEDGFFAWHRIKGYLLAEHIIKSVNSAKPVAPILNVKNAEICLSLDYGVMSMGCVSGLLGENVVKTDNSESGYGVMAENNYIEIGEDVAILTSSGELSPALVFGSNESYTGSAMWTGNTSWTGEDWQYATVTDIVREISGDEDKTVLMFAITNNELGYIFPDICMPKSILGALMFYKEDPGSMSNCVLLSPGGNCGSQLVEGYCEILKELYNK